MPKKTRVRTLMGSQQFPIQCLNQHVSIFVVFFVQYEKKSARKNLS